MLAAASEAEVDAYLAHERDEQRRLLGSTQRIRAAARSDDRGRRGRGVGSRVNGKRVDERTGERQPFRSVILPPWCRKSPRVAEVMPLLYDFVPVLETFSARPPVCQPRPTHG
jgi:putative transposase